VPSASDLRLFVEAARLGSLSAAARRLGRTPAAASATLKRLEAELGVRLIERSTRALRLTGEGALYRDRVAQGLVLLDEAEEVLRRQRDEVAGEIRLAAPVDLVRVWLRSVLDDFQARHPRVSFTLLAGDAMRHLVSEPLDLAIRYGELADSGLVARRLYDGRRVVVGAPSYLARRGRPAQPSDLPAHNCLAFFTHGAPHRRWSFRRGRRAVAVQVPGDRTSDDGGLIREWALAGYGLAYKSELDVRADIAAGRLEPILRDWQGELSPLNAVFPGSGPRPVRVRRLVDYVRERLRAWT